MLKLQLLIIFLLFFSCGNGNSDDDNDNISENSYGSDETLDIITWNLQNFPKHNNTVDTLSFIIDDLNLDIVALQEIESTSALSELSDNLGDNWLDYRSENSSWGELSYFLNSLN